MASSGEDQSSSMQELFASLRANGGRSYSATSSRPDENTGLGSSQSYPLDLTNPSLPSQTTSNLRPSSQSSGMSQSQNTLQPRAPSIVPQNAFPSNSGTPNLSDQSAADRTANLLSLLKFTQPTSSQGSSLQNTPSYTTRIEPTSHQSTPNLNRQSMHGRGPSASDLVASFMGRSTSSAQHETIVLPSAAKLPTDITDSSVSNPQEYLMQLLNRSKAQSTSSTTEVSRSQINTKPLTSKSEASVNKLSRAPAETSMQKEQSKPGQSEGGSMLRKDSPIRIFGTNSKETTPFEPQDMPKVEAPKESIFTYVNPFDQLAASSPRNAKSRPGSSTPLRGLAKSSKLGTNGEGVKRKSNEPSLAPKFAASRRKLIPAGSDIIQSIECPPPTARDDGRTPIEALIGIGAPTTDAETVAEALNGVGEQVSKQVEHALAQAVEADYIAQIKDEALEADEECVLEELRDELQEVAADVKEELDQDENQGILEEIMPESVAEAIKKVIVDAATGDVDGPARSAEHETTPSGASTTTAVPVYNFPMKPFVSIDVTQDEPCTRRFREEAIVEIARMKKEFDQIDRTLATASDTFIIYAIPKNGGLRIIRQEDGADRQVFKETHDRIFNVALSTAPSRSPLSSVQTSISTGISGTVYWTAISHEGVDCIQEESIEKCSLSFPPVPTHDENSSGGQLKTRAKKSSRHPEVFAIGRGKSIQLVFPFHAQKSHLTSSSVVDSENYFRDRNLRINTGKAGKDFAFSEDDTVITTLDKAGRLRFWDIRELMHESNGTASKIATNEIKTPLLTFSTAVANEKCWPTSVLYVDKLRPYTKCIALRYIIVGMKQNHTLQLWDLGLGKAVQELNFPHENESDAICSVSYHPASGMIVVGHPARNSIYFVHLSAPKYNLPPMSQAKFAQRLANKDSALPKPEATAIMSGMREYSFSSKGHLRSIDLLPISSESLRNLNSDVDPSLFELYVMHSKGATCLNIKKEDLGWSQDHKVMNPMDAEQLGQIEVRDLRDPQAAAVSEKSSVNGDTQMKLSMPSDLAHKGNSKEVIKAPSKASPRFDHIKTGTDFGIVDTLITPNITAITNGSTTNGTEKLDKKKKKRNAANPDLSSAVIPQAPVAPDTYAAAATRAHLTNEQPTTLSTKDSSTLSIKDSNRSKSSKLASADIPEMTSTKAQNGSERKLAEAESIASGISNDFLDKEFKKIEKIVSGEFSNVLNRELSALYRRFDEDKRIQDAAGAAKQDAILRLVSSTLTDNVDKALSRIIKSNIEKIVVPSISEVTASTLDKNVPTHLTQQLLHTLPAQLKLALPEAVFKSLQHPDVLRVLSDQVTTKVANQVERQFAVLLNQTVLPSFQNVAIGAAQRMAAETERRMSEQLKQVDVQHREDSAKIDQLTTLVRGLSETVSAMAAAQSGFQSEILRSQQQNAQNRQASSSAKTGSVQLNENSIAPTDSPGPVLTPEQQELDDITTLMNEGRFEEGTIMWLQSKQQGVLFDTFFVNCNPAYLRQCQSLVTLSVGAAVTSALENNLSERLDWLDIVLSILNTQDPDVREVAPRIMNVLSQRLESQYMRLAELDHRNPVLQKIPPLARRAREIAAFIE
ncbi:hypothetical protein MMC26_004690 [Xylographa opegraphella]|nr:hypothetical protein [Xylographa opegraphella]